MAKKIQSNICGMSKSFGPAASAVNGCRTPEVAGPCREEVAADGG